MQNLEHLEILKQGVPAWNQWRINNPHIQPNLTSVTLISANLRGADLTNVNLTGAFIRFADLTNASLNNAVLSNTDLSYTNFSTTELKNCDLSNAICYRTVFADVDLSTAKGLETIQHQGPSTIGMDTLLKSGKLPEEFLRGCGVPQTVIDNLPYIVDVPAIEFYKCFISHNSQDDEFVNQLVHRMRDNRLRVWNDAEDMKGGQKIHEQLNKALW